MDYIWTVELYRWRQCSLCYIVCLIHLSIHLNVGLLPTCTCTLYYPLLCVAKVQYLCYLSWHWLGVEQGV